MKLGYNTNGLALHRLSDALELLAETGYRSVAITLDHHCLDPYSPRLGKDIAATRAQLDRLGLSSVVETGARFLLDPRQKHEPTLLSPSESRRQVRLDFLRRSIDIAAELGSEAVSFWSGALRETLPEEAAYERLAAGCRILCEHAARKSVRLAFEPEPGMFIERMDQLARLRGLVDSPQFGLTLDVGHVHCLHDGEIPEVIRRWADCLWNVHIEDMRRGVHEHLRFGTGEIDFAPVLAALQEIGYAGGVHVELSRHSHMAPEVVRESYEFLSRII